MAAPIPSQSPVTPMDSLALVGEVGDWYIYWAIESPESIQNMMYSENTGAFLRGLTKTFNLPADLTPKLAFKVVQVAIGEIELARLGSVLSSELKLPNDTAQAVAKEIEKELFVPYVLEWNAWLEKLKREAEEAKKKQGQAGAQNVIDLKNRPGKTPRPNAQSPTKP